MLEELLGTQALWGRVLSAGARMAVWAAGHRGRVREWRRIAQACGFTNVREVRTLAVTHRVEADAGWLHIAFTSSAPREEDAPRGTIVISGVASGLHGPVEPSHRLGGFDVPKGMADIPPVGGPPILLCALFDAGARRLVAGLFESRVETEDGVELGLLCRTRIGDRTLTIDHEGDLSAQAVQGALRAARCLVSTEDAAAAAAANLRRETDPRLRVHVLRTLIAAAPTHAATEEAVREALTDGAEAMRLEAALASGEAGRPVLHALAAADDTPEAVLARTVTALEADLSSQELRALLAKAIARRRTQAAIACVELLAFRGPSETDPLLRALKCADPGVVVAAAQALGAHAESREAVIALREAQVLAPADRDLADAVRQSVSAIQLRLEKAGAGQLSVAGGETGTVSLADDPRGRVAIDPEDGPPQS